MTKTIVYSDTAPKPIGTYSQAVKADSLVFLSAQAPLVPETMTLVEGGIEAQITQVLDNLSAVTQAAGGSLSDMVKLTVYLTDLNNFPLVNQLMANYFTEPYAARAAVEVSRLPANGDVAIEGVMALK
ncbi:Rid family detoxifying hydrolase [Pseudoalteromonas sp. OOF1S-7]|uniref:Rid family detoxifying hydrolase n=1 Tax=Pseudoalteromonas sp. OOF1S-7 TaxID=2917757 RepID=UPI001EF58601|nr:Rid family detoxifying hydrolase [Pseudoalteromonas sp. OOF1S-7]MCG7533910.1 Rid family detoxifying hydrolase [Pseudoalteromonas sp. OOF1S-7]